MKLRWIERFIIRRILSRAEQKIRLEKFDKALSETIDILNRLLELK